VPVRLGAAAIATSAATMNVIGAFLQEGRYQGRAEPTLNAAFSSRSGCLEL
jgi:hypothetical protein